MTSWIVKLQTRLRREAFLPTLLGAVISPVYITRRGLYEQIRALAPRLSGRVLDFGCGSKPYEALFTSAAEYVGVDIEVSGHNHTRSKVDVYYDGKHLPFADAQFDAVVSFETFEHVFNLPEVLAEIRRVMLDGGQLLLSIPFAWDEHEVPYDYARYTSYGIAHSLRTSGFEVVELRKTTTYVLAIFQMTTAYVYQHVFPSRGPLRYVGQLAVIFPLNVLAYLCSAVLPKREQFYCNCVVLARKAAGATAAPPWARA